MTTDIEAWMAYSELPNDLRHKVRSYYANIWVRHEGEAAPAWSVPHAAPVARRVRLRSLVLRELLWACAAT